MKRYRVLVLIMAGIWSEVLRGDPQARAGTIMLSQEGVRAIVTIVNIAEDQYYRSLQLQRSVPQKADSIVSLYRPGRLPAEHNTDLGQFLLPQERGQAFLDLDADIQSGENLVLSPRPPALDARGRTLQLNPGFGDLVLVFNLAASGLALLPDVIRSLAALDPARVGNARSALGWCKATLGNEGLRELLKSDKKLQPSLLPSAKRYLRTPLAALLNTDLKPDDPRSIHAQESVIPQQISGWETQGIELAVALMRAFGSHDLGFVEPAGLEHDLFVGLRILEHVLQRYPESRISRGIVALAPGLGKDLVQLIHPANPGKALSSDESEHRWFGFKRATEQSKYYSPTKAGLANLETSAAGLEIGPAPLYLAIHHLTASFRRIRQLDRQELPAEAARREQPIIDLAQRWLTSFRGFKVLLDVLSTSIDPMWSLDKSSSDTSGHRRPKGSTDLSEASAILEQCFQGGNSGAALSDGDGNGDESPSSRGRASRDAPKRRQGGHRKTYAEER